MIETCPKCRTALRPHGQFCSHCGTNIQPIPASSSDPNQAVTATTHTHTRPSLLIAGVKGAAWGLFSEFIIALFIGIVKAVSLSTPTPGNGGYVAGLEARHVFQSLGLWPPIIGATIAVIRARKATAN